jgi:hypothetical protein
MTEIAVREDITPATPEAAARLVEWAKAATAAHQLATALAQTAFVPQQYRNKPGEATAAILAGAELGFDPLASLRAFDNIQGTVAPKAITLRAVAQSKGHELEVTEESDTRAVVSYRRNGSANWQTVEWTIEHARGLGLTGKDNWKKQPRAMLVARATSEAARRVASDAILGIAYSSEELRDHPAPIEAPSRRVTAAEITAKRPEAAEPTPVEDPPDESDGWPEVAPIPGTES